MTKVKYGVKPRELPCTLGEMDPGMFLFDSNTLGLKCDYKGDIFLLEDGSAFLGGASTFAERDEVIVWPIKIVKERDESELNDHSVENYLNKREGADVLNKSNESPLSVDTSLSGIDFKKLWYLMRDNFGSIAQSSMDIMLRNYVEEKKLG